MTGASDRVWHQCSSQKTYGANNQGTFFNVTLVIISKDIWWLMEQHPTEHPTGICVPHGYVLGPLLLNHNAIMILGILFL